MDIEKAILSSAVKHSVHPAQLASLCRAINAALVLAHPEIRPCPNQAAMQMEPGAV